MPHIGKPAYPLFYRMVISLVSLNNRNNLKKEAHFRALAQQPVQEFVLMGTRISLEGLKILMDPQSVLSKYLWSVELNLDFVHWE
ncbi:hypothetical protein BCY86_07030 [Pajaroellobacter abortibovis]|uniref:Uncharacterized protein n=1 Tax=Pajaroellobacter abortibovis TaxID=1882918 RepID=A0A1L6MYH2_9BACT|nr:hypothetical protein BCY86_07030 [Pajaroellobacter abortibovis]